MSDNGFYNNHLEGVNKWGVGAAPPSSLTPHQLAAHPLPMVGPPNHYKAQ